MNKGGLDEFKRRQSSNTNGANGNVNNKTFLECILLAIQISAFKILQIIEEDKVEASIC